MKRRIEADPLNLILGYFIETENSIYSTLSELVRCNRHRFKSSIMVPRPGQQVSEKELNSDPSTIAANMIAEVTSETLAPAHAIEKGLLHKLCKHGLDKMLASLLEIQKKFTSGVNAKYRGKTVRISYQYL